MTSLEHHTRRSAIHVAIILAIGTLTIAALATAPRNRFCRLRAAEADQRM